MNSEKPGVVYYRLTCKSSSGDGRKIDRSVNSDIYGADASVIETEKERIISQLRLIYCIIESRANSAQEFTIGNVTEDFRKALAGDESMKQIVEKSRSDFPLRSDLVSICREFKGSFKFVFTKLRGRNNEDLCTYIFNKSQELRNEDRNSLARNYLSLLANLRAYSCGAEMLFGCINADYVHRYADWLKESDITESTQSFYLRCLQLVLNKASSEGLIGDTSGWFRDVNTKIKFPRKTNRNKDGLDRALLLKLESLDLSENEQLSLVRDMFMFGLYCGGMELVDVANLTPDNLHNGVLTFRRRKKGLIRTIPLCESALKILAHYNDLQGNHLFPLLDKFPNVLYNSVRGIVDKNMREIGRIIGFEKLSFGMNVAAYKLLVSNINVPELLLKQV